MPIFYVFGLTRSGIEPESHFSSRRSIHLTTDNRFLEHTVFYPTKVNHCKLDASLFFLH